MSEFKVIDMTTWPRRQHCAIFRNSLQPQYGISFTLDVTIFRRRMKAAGIPFSLAFICAVAKCANEVENFRYRFAEGQVVLYDCINTSFTYLKEDEELFSQINVPMQDTLEEFVGLAQKTITEQEDYFTVPPGNDSFIFSAVPWIPFQYVSHTFSGNKEAACPMFDWGRFQEADGRTLLPFTVQVHHSFVDGIHIARFYERLQDQLSIR